MEELTEKQVKNAAKIIERMAGQTEKSIKLHEEIIKATPTGIIKTKTGAILEQIKLPKLSELNH